MTYIWNLINTLKYLSGVACLAILLVGVFKILIGDEQDTKKYVTRCKNAIIAIVLIFTVVNLANLVANYFSDSEGNVSFSIGSLSNTDITSAGLIADTGLTITATEALDSIGSHESCNYNYTDYEVLLVDGNWYYITKIKEHKNLGSFWNSCTVYRCHYLKSVDNNTTDYYYINAGSDLAGSSVSPEHFIIPSQSFMGTKYYSAEEIADAVLYTISEEAVDENGTPYLVFTSGNITVSD